MKENTNALFQVWSVAITAILCLGFAIWQRPEPCQCDKLLQMIQRANRRIAVLEANQRKQEPLPPCDLQDFEFKPEDYR